MIVEVYPIRRMPRRLAFFDYTLKEGTEISRGMFVEIPLKNSRVMGIVRKVKDKPPRGLRLKPILGVVQRTALRDQELSFIEELSHVIAQPVSNLLVSALPRFSKQEEQMEHPQVISDYPLTIPKSEAPVIARIVGELSVRSQAFAQAPDLKRAAAIISGYIILHPNEKMMVVCPHVHDVRVLLRLLGHLSPIVVTGDESDSARYGAWHHYRQKQSGILLVTRAGLLYGDAMTSAVFLVRSGHPDHALHDRNPRLDARATVRLFCERMNANLFFIDVIPTPDDLFYFGKEHMLSYPIASIPVFINGSRERSVSSNRVLCSTSSAIIADTLNRGERVMIIFNKKGYTRRLQCKDCGLPVICDDCKNVVRVHSHTIECMKCSVILPIPHACSSCHRGNLDASGYGIERIAADLQQLFPTFSCDLLDADHDRLTDAPIMLVTQWYLESVFDPLKQERFGYVIHLDPDTPLFTAQTNASVRALHSLAQWHGVAHAFRAKFLVQSDDPDWFEKYLLSPESFGEEELERRQAYKEPPFFSQARIVLKEDHSRKAEIALHELKVTLEKIHGVSVLIEEPSASVRFDPTCKDEVLEVFSALDDRYIIDMFPSV